MVNKSSMLYWWPRVKHLSIPMPKTIIAEQMNYTDWIKIIDSNGLLPKSTLTKISIAAKKLGYPVFMRTDLSSDKHHYLDTCLLTDPERISFQIQNLIDNSFIEDIGFEAIIIREFLPLIAPFKTHIGLPVGKERRYFAENGNILVHHPYWSEDAMQFYNKWSSEIPGWKKMLQEINNETPDEISLLTKYAEKLSLKFDGPWSFDFAQTINGTWYFIDAAEAMKSYIDPRFANDIN